MAGEGEGGWEPYSDQLLRERAAGVLRDVDGGNDPVSPDALQQRAAIAVVRREQDLPDLLGCVRALSLQRYLHLG